MLNKVILMGRITHDLELKQSQSGTAVLKFRIAVERHSKGEEKQADFISCTAFGKRAEFIANYFGKGRMIALEGNIKTGSYTDQNGAKRYTTDVWVDNVSFTGEKSERSENGAGGAYNGGNASQDNFSGSGTNDGHTAAQPPYGTGANESADTNASTYYDSLFDDSGVPF